MNFFFLFLPHSQGVHGTYKAGLLRKWRPAPTVQPAHRGLPGELGKAVHIPPEQEAEMKEKFKLNQFNLMASDMISLNRSLADVRLDGWVIVNRISKKRAKKVDIIDLLQGAFGRNESIRKN